MLFRRTPSRTGAGARAGFTASLRRHATRRRLEILVVVPQLVALTAIALLVHPLALLVAVPVAAHLTRAFRIGWRSHYSVEPRDRRHLYLGLWPFFAWWCAAGAFTLLAPVAGLVALLAGHARVVFAVAAAVAAVLGWMAVRRDPRIARVTVRVPDLPPSLEGYRIVQLSDVHCGPFAPERRVEKWVRRANRLGGDLVAVTGDLVAGGTSHVTPVARALGGLVARDGVFACMGNHDYFGAGEPLVSALERHGITVLRNRGVDVSPALHVAGVDDTWAGRDDAPRALARRPPGSYAVLLAHDPDVFPRAVDAGADLVLSGHTHGGQLGVPFASKRWNVALLVTRFTAGEYRLGDGVLYVNRGLGTTGPPVRIGARAEIAVITLLRR